MIINKKILNNDQAAWLYLLLAMLYLGIQAYAGLQLFSGQLKAVYFLYLHLGLILLLAAFTYIHYKRKLDLRLPVIFFTLFFFCGPLGAFTYILLYLIYLMISHSKDPTAWLAMLLPESEETLSENIYQRLIAGHDDLRSKTHAVPFHSILKLGTSNQKHVVLGKINRHFNQRFAPLLFEALTDKNNAVRIHAATVIAKLEQEMPKQIMEIEEKIKKNPDDYTLLFTLACHCDNYSATGILRKETEQALREKSIKNLLAYLAFDKDSVPTHFFLGRLYIRTKQAEKALPHLKFCIDSSGEEFNFISWYLECLYRLGRLDEVRTFAKQRHESTTDYTSDSSNIIKILAAGVIKL